MPTIRDIISAIEDVAPLSLQESWDNSGLQLGAVSADCTGVVTCLDVTDRVIDFACKKDCNLIVSHHPLLFKGLKCINPDDHIGRLVYRCITAGIAVYSAHTSLDSAPAPNGVSHVMAAMMGAAELGVLDPQPQHRDCGIGVVALMPHTINGTDFIATVKSAFSVQTVRYSDGVGRQIRKVAFGGGSCGYLIPKAIASGADAIVTSDVRYHDFLDYGDKILIVDLSHFDTEKCTNEILMRIISQKFHNFAACYSGTRCNTDNPINYM
ncbi:MAG: Nif3-like dinuclear metal center hexameric protein [Muribaculaceae bacterium]|nr:Nif3-like dinuclear metal center hexameric protein [Muribaculaceae bacterium]